MDTLKIKWMICYWSDKQTIKNLYIQILIRYARASIIDKKSEDIKGVCHGGNVKVSKWWLQHNQYALLVQ
jgi:hypothetical protein